jgi:hypothetical protein
MGGLLWSTPIGEPLLRYFLHGSFGLDDMARRRGHVHGRGAHGRGFDRTGNRALVCIGHAAADPSGWGLELAGWTEQPFIAAGTPAFKPVV